MKSKISKIVASAGSLLVLPFITFAEVPNQQFGGFIFDLIAFVKRVLDQIFPMITIVLVILFAWQLIQFLSKKGDDVEKAEKLKQRLFNSFIVLFIWFTLFGLINILGNAFKLDPGSVQDKVPVLKV
jgi:hypothetical protein